LYPRLAPTPMTGVLLNQVTTDLAANPIQTTTYAWGKRMTKADCPWGETCNSGGGSSRGQLYLPELLSKTISRGGASDKTTYSAYDSEGFPHTVTQSSAQGSKTDALTYYENPAKGMYKLANDTTTGPSGTANSITRSFDTNGNLTSESVNGVTTHFTYDSGGNKLTQTDADGHTTHFATYVAGLPETVTDPMGHVTKYAVNTNGTVSTMTTPMGETTHYTYGPLYRLTGIVPPLHLATSLAWNDTSGGTTMTMTRGKHVKTIQYNSLGKPTATIDSDGTTSHAVYQAYDNLNRLVKQTVPTTVGNTSAPGTTFTYDALNRVTSQTQAGSFTTHMQYNDASNSVVVTDPNGAATTDGYRSFGDPDVKQLLSIAQPDGVTTTMTKTVAGLITAITQGPMTRHYTYDAHHYLTSMTDPEIGTTSETHDAVGNLLTQQVGSEKANTFAYDADNHLVTTTDTGSNGKGQTTTRHYDADGRLTTVANTASNSTWAYTYDAVGNLTGAVLTVNGLSFAFAMGYDGYDHLILRAYPNGLALTYAVNPLGQIQAITDANNKTAYVSGITYFPDNHIASMTDGNGVVTTYTENSRDMRNSIVTMAGSQALVRKQYVYDGVGNILSITDGVNGANTQTMGYDGINRLVEATGPWGDMQLSYDTNSNVTQKQIGKVSTSYHYNSNNQLTSLTGAAAQTLAYSNGDATQIGNLHLAYNTLQQVESMSGTGLTGNAVNDSFAYDGNGNRVLANQNGKTHIEAYNQKDQLLFKDNTSDNTQDDYILLGTHPVVHIKTQAGQTQVNYLHDNLLGSALVSTDEKAKAQWTERYKPYGDEMDANTGRENPHVGYTGKPHDSDTDLSYYGARYYDPAIGRFISPDPMMVNPANPITFNRYAYASDNPYKYVDPNGKGVVTALIGGAIGGYFGGKEHGFWGGVIGFGVGFVTGTVDPWASGMAAEAATGWLGAGAGAVAEYATSAAVNVAGNMGYSEIMDGNTGGAASILSGAVGAGAGYLLGNVAGGAARELGGSENTVSKVREIGNGLGVAPGNEAAGHSILHITMRYSGVTGRLTKDVTATFDNVSNSNQSMGNGHGHQKSQGHDHDTSSNGSRDRGQD